jgi:hypothetical protein
LCPEFSISEPTYGGRFFPGKANAQFLSTFLRKSLEFSKGKRKQKGISEKHSIYKMLKFICFLLLLPCILASLEGSWIGTKVLKGISSPVLMTVEGTDNVVSLFGGPKFSVVKYLINIFMLTFSEVF